MKLFLGVTRKVYHVLPANKIHETKILVTRMIADFPCIADLYVNITQLLLIIRFRNFIGIWFLDLSIRQKRISPKMI